MAVMLAINKMLNGRRNNNNINEGLKKIALSLLVNYNS